jgi:hypothetical protein
MRDFDAQSPPPELKSRVHDTLRSRGLLNPQPRASGRRIAMVAAASVIVFAGGLAAGRWAGMPARDDRPQFMLLLYEDSAFVASGTSSRAAEYGRWADSLGALGSMESGDELATSERWVTSRGDHQAAPAGAGTARIGGYFLLRAESISDAAHIAATCPHVRYGGAIAVRAIVQAARPPGQAAGSAP